MLTLGQAFIAKPKLLMIDELSLGLAPMIVEQLLDIVRAIHESGTTIVLVEQSVNVAVSLAQRAIFLEKGTVRFSGPTDELLERGDILRAVFPRCRRRARRRRRSRTPAPVRRCVRALRARARGGPEVSDLAVRFGRHPSRRRRVVRGARRAGPRLIGPNGAGKTTVLDLISGYLAPTAGRVWLQGEDVTQLAPDVRSWKGAGPFLPGRAAVRHSHSARSHRHRLERHVPVRALAAFVLSPAVKISEREVDAEVDELIELMRLEAYADKFVGELSTGSRRIVDLACVLAHGPSVLLLDEPSSGIAQRETEALGPVLLDVRDRTGAAIVVIEHDIPLISSISDELIAMEAGRPIARGRPDEVLSDPQVVAGYLGGSDVAVQRSGAEDGTGQEGGQEAGGDAVRAPGDRRRPSIVVGALAGSGAVERRLDSRLGGPGRVVEPAARCTGPARRRVPRRRWRRTDRRASPPSSCRSATVRT